MVNDLKQKLAEAQAQREHEEDLLDSGAESREESMASEAKLEGEVKGLQTQLAAYSDNDPTELERKKREIEEFKNEAEHCTDDIYSMEGWFKKIGGYDEEAIKGLRMMFYGDELDEEEGVLKELM